MAVSWFVYMLGVLTPERRDVEWQSFLCELVKLETPTQLRQMRQVVPGPRGGEEEDGGAGT